MRALIPVENRDPLSAVRGFLKRLLEEQVVEALLVPMETVAGTIVPTLVTDAGMLDAANPLAPVMGLNAARVAGRVSIREPRGRVGVVLRSCELRALVELVKLKQASLDDMVTISVDCLGTYDVPVYLAMQANGGVDMVALLATAQSGDLALMTGEAALRTGEAAPQNGYAFRDACQMCEKPTFEGADVTLELLGADLTTGIPVSLPDEMAARLGVASTPELAKEGASLRKEVVDKVVAARTQVRDARFAEIRQRLDEEGVGGVFAACVRCHNCMTVVPSAIARRVSLRVLSLITSRCCT